MGFSVKVGIVGAGTVGCGVVKILEDNASVIKSRLGFPIEIAWVCDIDLKRERPVDISKYRLTDSYEDVINDEDVDIVVELIGGLDVAKDVILGAVSKGKHVVTANKALLAEDGKSIFDAVIAKGVNIGFEASVAGGIPIIKAIREGLCANRIRKIYGIINGTANYVLTKMEKENVSFSEALKEAQKNGYAEADPTLDIDGIDAAHKTAILATLSFGSFFNMSNVYVEGIKEISLQDIVFAGDFGYKVKLLSIIKREGNVVELRVHPTLIPSGHELSKVEGVFNAISVFGDAVGHTIFYGMGAGMMPTASAVVSDIMDISRDLYKGVSQRVLFDFEFGSKPYMVKSPDEFVCKYYLRFTALDRPGVLSKISGILARYSISIESVIQKGRREKGYVPIVMMTHEAKEADVKRALDEIDRLDVVGKRTILIRVEENG